MNIYLFLDLSDLTYSYHNGGSAAVVAETIEKAINALPEACQTEASNDYVAGRVREFELDPRFDHGSEVFIFPDEGCC